MAEESENRENLSLHRKGDMIGVTVTCNLPIIIKLILVFVVKLNILILTCNQYNIEF
jgi:hypothetical protein